MTIGRRALIGATVALAAAPSVQAQAAPIARTAYGRVRGAQAGEVLTFKGVGYGAPTRRFQAPEQPRSWRGVLETLAFGPACPPRGLGDEAQSEDASSSAYGRRR